METLSRTHRNVIIALCFALYAISYMTRLSYAAELVTIGSEFPTAKSELGLVGSFLFFSYGAGQLCNFFLAKHYDPKIVVSLAALATATCNLIMPFVSPAVMKFVWLANGIAQCMFWCNMLNVETRFLPQESNNAVILVNSLSVGIGTAAVYGLSAICGARWRICFYIVAGLAYALAVVWFFVLRYTERKAGGATSAATDGAPAVRPRDRSVFGKRFYLLFSIVVIDAVLYKFIWDGIVTWLPTILNEDFGMRAAWATCIIVLLSLLAIVGVRLGQCILKRTGRAMPTFAIMLAFIAVLIGGGIALYRYRISWAFVLVFCTIGLNLYGVGSIMTSQIPFRMQRYADVGGISAFLDAFCYVGSTLATYAFGAVSDVGGWEWVLYLVLGVSVLSSALSVLCGALARRDPVLKTIF